MAIEDGTRDEEESNCTASLLWPVEKAMMTDGGAELRKNEPDVVEEYDVGGRPTCVISKKIVQLGAMSAITAQRAIFM